MKLLKKCTACFTALTMLIGIGFSGYTGREVSILAEAGVFEDIEKYRYGDVIELRAAELSAMRLQYACQDLNADGIPELILSYGEIGATDYHDIYTYIDDVPVLLGTMESGGGEIRIIPSKRTIIAYTSTYGNGNLKEYVAYQMTGSEIEQIDYYAYYDNYGYADAEPSYYLHGNQEITVSEYTAGVNSYLNQSTQLNYYVYDDIRTKKVSGKCGDNLTWAVHENGVLLIQGTGDMYDYDADENGWNAPWASYADEIYSVSIGEGVTSIGGCAFATWSNLRLAMVYGETIRIGYASFAQCTSLEKVSIPGYVTEIGGLAFQNTPLLKAAQAQNPFVSVNGILFDATTCKGDVTIPEYIRIIGEGSFIGNNNITSVTVPNNVNKIYDYAFASCPNLTSVTIMNSSCEIDSSNNQTLGIPGVTTIRGYSDSTAQSYANKYDYTFSAIDAVTTKATTTSSTKSTTSTTTTTIPTTTTETTAVSDSGNILTGTFGENLTWTFKEATGLLTISGTGDMKNIPLDADSTSQMAPWYRFREDIKKVVIENGITSIGNYTFPECTSLISVILPDSIASIGEYAFTNCTSLAEVTLPIGITGIGNAFNNTAWLKEKQSEPLFILNGTLFSVQSTTATESIIPDNVTIIGEDAFNGCNSLKSIIVPNHVKSIEARAFYNCNSLNSITIKNPDCRICDDTSYPIGDGEYASKSTLSATAIIYGYPNSTAQAYAEKYNRTFIALNETELELSFGDLDNSGEINASDAALILVAAANQGSGQESGLTEEQKTAADVNHDGNIDASDAAYILQYAAAAGAGVFSGNLSDFMDNLPEVSEETTQPATETTATTTATSTTTTTTTTTNTTTTETTTTTTTRKLPSISSCTIEIEPGKYEGYFYTLNISGNYDYYYIVCKEYGISEPDTPYTVFSKNASDSSLYLTGGSSLDHVTVSVTPYYEDGTKGDTIIYTAKQPVTAVPMPENCTYMGIGVPLSDDGFVNLRSSMSLSDNIITEIPNSTRIQMYYISDAADWVFVEYGEYAGYAKRSYVKLIDAQGAWADGKNAYDAELQEFGYDQILKSKSSILYAGYALFDMNHDEIPELIIDISESGTEGGREIAIYTYSNGKPFLMKSGISGWHVSFMKENNKNQLVTVVSQMGYGKITWYQCSRTTVQIEKEQEFEYSDMENYNVMLAKYGSFSELDFSSSYD